MCAVVCECGLCVVLLHLWVARYSPFVGMHRCRRCDDEVEGQYEQPKLRRLARFYFLVPIPFVPLLPIIAADFMVMIPLTMLYLLGAGAALRFITQKPVCPECGAFVQPA